MAGLIPLDTYRGVWHNIPSVGNGLTLGTRKARIMLDTTYNGWTNYATWRVNLEFFSEDADVYARNYTAESAREYVTEIIEEEFRFTILGVNLDQSALVQYALAEGWEYSTDEVDLTNALELARKFIEDVNWDEIAEMYTETEDDY